MEKILGLLPVPTILISPSNTILQVSRSFTELCELEGDYVGLDIESLVSDISDFSSEQIVEGIDAAVREGCMVITEPWQVDEQFWRVKVTPIFSLESKKRKEKAIGEVKYLREVGSDVPKGVVNIWNHVTVPGIENSSIVDSNNLINGDGNGDKRSHTNNSTNKTNNTSKTLNNAHKPRTRAAVARNHIKHPRPDLNTRDPSTKSLNRLSSTSTTTLSSLPHPDVEYILLQWEDVTEETNRIQSLKDRLQSSEIYRLLVNTVKDYAIFLLDSDGYIATWNTGAMLLKQYLPHEIIGLFLGVHCYCFEARVARF